MKTLTVGVFHKDFQMLSYSTPFCVNNSPLKLVIFENSRLALVFMFDLLLGPALIDVITFCWGWFCPVAPPAPQPICLWFSWLHKALLVAPRLTSLLRLTVWILFWFLHPRTFFLCLVWNHLFVCLYVLNVCCCFFLLPISEYLWQFINPLHFVTCCYLLQQILILESDSIKDVNICLRT